MICIFLMHDFYLLGYINGVYLYSKNNKMFNL